MLAVFHAAAAAAMAGCCRACGFSAEQHSTANVGSPHKTPQLRETAGGFPTSARVQMGRFIFKGNSSFFFLFFLFSSLFLTSEVALKDFGEGMGGEGGGFYFLASNLLRKPEFCTCITLKAEAG